MLRPRNMTYPNGITCLSEVDVWPGTSSGVVQECGKKGGLKEDTWCKSAAAWWKPLKDIYAVWGE